MRIEPGVEPISIDVALVLRRSVESLYSHLVTRPQAVRFASPSKNRLPEVHERLFR